MSKKIIAMDKEYTMIEDNHYIYIVNNETGFEVKCFKHLTLNDIQRGKQLAKKYGWDIR
jgi:hypothetical protein